MDQKLKNLQQKYAVNLFDWVNFESINDSKVLVFGDVDENFIFPIASRVGHLSIVLETNEIAEAVNYISLPQNVSVYKDLINDDANVLREKLSGKTFDFVLIPSMSTIIEGFLGKTIDEIINEIADKWTSRKGKIYLAFDNKYSFDTIGGVKVDDDIVTFSYDDIKSFKENYLKKYKSARVNVYYPMPEYRFPLRIYSDKYLPKLEDESAMTRNLIAIDKFKDYCNSYILSVELDKDKSKDEYETIYVKYNVNRTKEYALTTRIEENEKKERQVVKKAKYKESNNQIDTMVSNVDIITSKLVEILKPKSYIKAEQSKDGKAYAIYPYVDGEMLTDVIFDRIKKGDDEKEVITEYMYKLIGKFNGIIQNYNLDCTFQNAMVKDGKIYVIDSEWVYRDTTEVDFLRYRILKYFWKSCRQYLTYASFKDLLREFGIGYLDAERYEEAENEFQSKVHENINNLDINQYEELKPVITFRFLNSPFFIFSVPLLKNIS